MRTTITLDPDTEALVRSAMAERGIGFKEAVNEAIRRGLTTPRSARPRFTTPTYDLGGAPIPGHRVLALAAQLEDEELLRKRELGK
ncbi:MAG: antitoxin [Phycicoccus sp.]